MEVAIPLYIHRLKPCGNSKIQGYYALYLKAKAVWQFRE
jgi:hypothetical protein